MLSTGHSCCPSSPQLACRPPLATTPLLLRCAGAMGVAGPALPGVPGVGSEVPGLLATCAALGPVGTGGRPKGGWAVWSRMTALTSILKLRRMGLACARITPCAMGLMMQGVDASGTRVGVEGRYRVRTLASTQPASKAAMKLQRRTCRPYQLVALACVSSRKACGTSRTPAARMSAAAAPCVSAATANCISPSCTSAGRRERQVAQRGSQPWRVVVGMGQ